MNPSARGTLYCILSAISYTMMGVCLRELSESCDPVWVNSVQALVGTTVFGVYLIFRSVRGRSVWPPLSVAASLIGLGIITQLGGSSYQWSLGVVGLSVGNPLNMGVMLAASALLGFLILGERVSWRGVVAVVLITISIFLLGHSAEVTNRAELPTDATASTTDSQSTDVKEATMWPGSLQITMGIAAACFAGIAFAILTVGVRKTATEDTAPEAIVFYINAMGVAFLGPWAAARLGLDGMMATSVRDYGVMLATGVFNLFGFLFVTKALQLTAVVRVNLINSAVTTALTVLAGIVLFAEPANRELVAGIILTLIAMVLISTGEHADDQPESTDEAVVETVES